MSRRSFRDPPRAEEEERANISRQPGRTQSHLQMWVPGYPVHTRVCMYVQVCECVQLGGSEMWKCGECGGGWRPVGNPQRSRAPVSPSQFVTDEAIGNKQRGDSNCLSFSAVVHWVLSSRQPPRERESPLPGHRGKWDPEWLEGEQEGTVAKKKDTTIQDDPINRTSLRSSPFSASHEQGAGFIPCVPS